MAKAGEPARRASCMNNVRQIGLSMFSYAEDHDGVYPPTLSVLMKDGYITTWKVFLCLSSNDRPGEGFISDPQADLKKMDLAFLDTVEERGSYALVKGLKHEKRPDVIVLYDKPGHHKGEGRNCFFDDGQVKWLSEADFEKRMKEQEAKLREIGPAEKGARPLSFGEEKR
jgi:hypothetical protein